MCKKSTKEEGKCSSVKKHLKVSSSCGMGMTNVQKDNHNNVFLLPNVCLWPCVLVTKTAVSWKLSETEKVAKVNNANTLQTTSCPHMLMPFQSPILSVHFLQSISFPKASYFIFIFRDVGHGCK